MSSSFFFPLQVFKTWCVYFTYLPPQCGLAIFQVLSSRKWPVAAVLNRTRTFFRMRDGCWSLSVLAAKAKLHSLGGFHTTENCFSPFWRPEDSDQGACRVGVRWGPLRGYGLPVSCCVLGMGREIVSSLASSYKGMNPLHGGSILIT